MHIVSEAEGGTVAKTPIVICTWWKYDIEDRIGAKALEDIGLAADFSLSHVT
jgi:hypothetical protein